MNMLRKFLFSLVLLTAATNAFAAGVHATWNLPTQNTDTSPLAVADMASTTLQYGTCNGTAFGAALGAVNVLSPLAAADIPALAPGAYCFRAFVTTIPTKGGVVSAFSNVAQATVPFPTPGAPSNLAITLTFP